MISFADKVSQFFESFASSALLKSPSVIIPKSLFLMPGFSIKQVPIASLLNKK